MELTQPDVCIRQLLSTSPLNLWFYMLDNNNDNDNGNNDINIQDEPIYVRRDERAHL